MSYARKAKRDWSDQDRATLRKLAGENAPVRAICFELGRTDAAVRTMAARLGVSLAKQNQSPYSERK